MSDGPMHENSVAKEIHVLHDTISELRHLLVRTQRLLHWPLDEQGGPVNRLWCDVTEALRDIELDGTLS